MKADSNQKKILTSIGIFGSMHMVSMVISVVRSKVAALWLGSAGIGVLGLLTTSVQLITTVVNVGLPMILVRYLAGKSDEELSKKLTISQIVLLLTGTVGSILVLIFAASLSYLTFKNYDFTWAFRWIALSIFFKQLAVGYASFLQSQSKVILYANANLIGNTIGIIFTLPLYYYWGISGLVYNFVCVAMVEGLVFYTAYRTARFSESKVSSIQIKTESKKLIQEGAIFNMSSIFTLLAIYVVQVFVSKQSSLEILGIYLAGFAILNTYVAIVFNIMSMDYFPRISKIEKNTPALNEEVNHQFYIGMLIITPVLLGLLLVAPYVIQFLYSEKFLHSTFYIYGALLGVFFKMFSWTIGYVIIAKGNEKMIIGNSIFYNTIFIGIHIIGFYWAQLEGIAIASSIYYLIHLFGNLWITRRYFQLKISAVNINMYIQYLLLLIAALTITLWVENIWIKYTLVGSFFFAALFLSFKKLYNIYNS